MATTVTGTARTRRSPVRRSGVAALLAAAPLVLSAACATAAVPASQATPVGSGIPLSQASPAASPVDLGVATAVTPVGTVLTNNGFTLYRYAKDRSTPPFSACTGGCAVTWPPVVPPDPPGGIGMDTALLGTVSRADGTRQLTVGGWPVYRFARDDAPGDVKGQGANGGAWTAIGIDGTPVVDAAARAPAAKRSTAAGS